MNELTELRAAWERTDPPSPAAHTAARAALMRQIAADGTSAAAHPLPRRRGVRYAWLTGGTAATAALAAAVVFAVAPGTTRPGQPAGGTPGHANLDEQAGRRSGQQILLAAATVAESRPAGTAKYWHVKESFTDPAAPGTENVQETWTTRDGTLYLLARDAGGVIEASQGNGFQVGFSQLAYAELERLPTDPAALRTWITDSLAHPHGAGKAPKIPADGLDTAVTDALGDLIWQVPSPPAVRAAALRVLASMPNVTSLGEMDGGQGLRVAVPPPPADKFPGGKRPAGSDEITLVLDPATSMLLSEVTYQGTHRILASEWTDEMPSIVQAPNK
ncbi:CU044_5270 family protein [Micromonospora sp. NPDC049559]|uniref:CU044_5270 family protein n=1 Tax=Micromonospora sp. NPDC049559 TaxID=3155923 RepID=UPI003428DD04